MYRCVCVGGGGGGGGGGGRRGRGCKSISSQFILLGYYIKYWIKLSFLISDPNGRLVP